MKIKSLFSKLLCFLCLSVVVSSCMDLDSDSDSDYDPYAQFQTDSVIIQDYITEHNLSAYPVNYDGYNTGVYCSKIEEGTEDRGEYPTSDDYVWVKYKGYLTDGTVFDETSDTTSVQFPLSSLIAGWQFGLSQMAKGDKSTFMIPSLWGYRNTAYGDIPANSVLIFDIELEKFE